MGKRGHGEGSVYQTADGAWRGAITVGYTAEGKQQRRTVKAKTQRECITKLKALQARYALGAPPEKQTVAQFLDTWLEQTIKPNRRPRTYRSYRDTVRLHIVPHIGARVLARLTTPQVQTMINAIAAAVSPHTASYARKVLSRAINVALKWGDVTRNVAALSEAPRVEERAIEFFTPEQARAFLAAVKGHRLEALYRVALALGLRKAEIVGLRWDDIDFAACTIRITSIVQREEGKVTRSPTKTKAGGRTLPLPPVMLLALQQRRAIWQNEREQRADEWQEQGLVFPSEIGTPLEHGNLHRQFKAMLRKAGLPETIRFHDQRHSCATFLIAQGVHPRVVMQYLGHTKMSFTMELYGHVLEENQRDAANQIDDLLDERKSA
jgi:integrase